MEDLFSAAKNFHAEGDIRSAEKHYKQVLRLDPGNSNALYLLAVLLHENGRSIRALSLLRKGLDAVSDQLMSDDSAEIREEIFSVCEEEAERGAEMIITFATDKGLKLDATADELVDHLENLDDDEDIEFSTIGINNLSRILRFLFII